MGLDLNRGMARSGVLFGLALNRNSAISDPRLATSQTLIAARPKTATEVIDALPAGLSIASGSLTSS